MQLSPSITKPFCKPRSIAPRSLRFLQPKASMQTQFVPAIVTPFRPEGAEIHLEGMKPYLQGLWKAGIRDIVVNGSTGEFASLALEERESVAEFVRANWPGRQFVNISSCNVQDALRLLRHCQQTKEHLKGDRCIGDGVLLLPPYYFAAATHGGLEAFFQAIIKESQLPVYLYNFPANTGGQIPVELYASLAKQFPQLRGIKNTFDDLPLQKRFKAAAPDRQVYVGHDPSVLVALENGLDGAISATANVMPEHMIKVADAFQRGDNLSAKQHLENLNAWNNAVEEFGVNIFAAVKAGVHHHYPQFPTAVRPPLEAATEQQAKQLSQYIVGVSQ